MKKSKDLAILSYSCQKNADMWNVFLTLFKKYWPDCQYQLILLTDKRAGGSAEAFAQDKELNFYQPGTAYSFSTQVGIWSVDCLKQYVKKNGRHGILKEKVLLR